MSRPRGRIRLRDERGFTLIELLVGAMISLLALGAILTIVQVATQNQDRAAKRVAANQRARPAMTRIVDRLHSACVAPGVAPVQAGSDGDTLIVLSKAGDEVAPTPDKYLLDLNGSVLSEAVYAGSGSEPSKWAFATQPTSNVQILDGVGTAAAGDPPVAVPVFRYFAYAGGQVDPVPLPTPLSPNDAARTVQVDIAFAVSPGSTPPAAGGAAISLTGSATLRIEPASEDSAKVNLPCV